MPRRFTVSLRHLLITVTVVCFFCALVFRFPITAQVICLFIPTAVVCLVIGKLSRDPIASVYASILGAWPGILFMPMIGWSLTPHWHGFPDGFLFLSMPPALGALLIGAIVLLAEQHQRRKPNA
jgi:hypothetical protein